MSTILKQHHIRRFDAQEVLTQLRKEPLPVPAATTALAQEHLSLLWQQLTLIGHQLQELEQQLIATLENQKTNSATPSEPSHDLKPQKPSDCDILASIPGIGKMVLATLLGEAGPGDPEPRLCRVAMFNGDRARPCHQKIGKILSCPTSPSS